MWAGRINSHGHHEVPLLVHLSISWGSYGYRECFSLKLHCGCTAGHRGLVLSFLAMPVEPLLCLSKCMEHWTYLTAKVLGFFFPSNAKIHHCSYVCRVVCPVLRTEYDFGFFDALRQNPCIVQSVSMQCSTSFPLDTQPSVADKAFFFGGKFSSKILVLSVICSILWEKSFLCNFVELKKPHLRHKELHAVYHVVFSKFMSNCWIILCYSNCWTVSNSRSIYTKIIPT